MPKSKSKEPSVPTTISGTVISVKEKFHDKRGRYFGVTLRPIKGKQRFWFACNEEDAPSKGDSLTIVGEIDGQSEDGGMVWLKNVQQEIGEHLCDHETLAMASIGRYACILCGVELSVR
jgi:hypothetical protein